MDVESTELDMMYDYYDNADLSYINIAIHEGAITAANLFMEKTDFRFDELFIKNLIHETYILFYFCIPWLKILPDKLRDIFFNTTDKILKQVNLIDILSDRRHLYSWSMRNNVYSKNNWSNYWENSMLFVGVFEFYSDIILADYINKKIVSTDYVLSNHKLKSSDFEKYENFAIAGISYSHATLKTVAEEIAGYSFLKNYL
jgi:hypothetical protein